MRKRGIIYRKSKPRSRFFKILKRYLHFADLHFQQYVLFSVVGYLLLQVLLQHASRTTVGYLTPVSRPSHQAAFIAQIGATFVDYGENSIPTPSPFGDQIVYHGMRGKKAVALTFDADMTPEMKYFLTSGQVKSYYDPRITDYLVKSQTKATFFLTGMWIELYPQETQELAGNPLFELANHSYSHPSFDGVCYGLGEIPDSEDGEQVQKTQDLLKSVAHINGKYFRFPGGCSSKNDVDIVSKLGLTVVHWDSAGEDGFNSDRSAIEQNVLRTVQNGSIIVLHLSGPPNAPETADALPDIIGSLKNKGYYFVTVSELLNENAISDAFNLREYVDRQYGIQD